MKALILVDLQNDFLPGGALGVPRGDEVIPVANRLQQVFDRVIATKDWHPRNHGSFASNHPGHEVGDVVSLGGEQQVLWPDHCIQYTPGAEFSSELVTTTIEKVFFKGVDPDVDSYSALYDNAHIRATGLGGYLKESGLDELYVMGLATDYCVKFTALDALQEGFTVRVVADGCRAVDVDAGDGERALAEIRDAGAEIVTSEDVLAFTEPVAVA